MTPHPIALDLPPDASPEDVALGLARMIRDIHADEDVVPCSECRKVRTPNVDPQRFLAAWDAIVGIGALSVLGEQLVQSHLDRLN